jgi:Na+-driven multidrug efflux pump
MPKTPQKDAQISTTHSLPSPTPHSPNPSTLKSLTWEIFSDGAINSISGLAVKLSSFLLIFLSGQLQESAL